MSKKPFLLLSNDDGFDAQGLRSLVNGLKDVADLMVVAPAFEKSGTSHSISLKDEMALIEKAPNQYAFDGTPVDCVSFALRNLVSQKPDFVISGINHGANLGSDTLYSGTVGAAMNGSEAGIPSIAVSLVDYHGEKTNHFESAVNVVKSFLKEREIWNDLQGRVVNLNVPNLASHEIRGVKVTKLGERIYSEEFINGEIPNTFRYHHEEPIDFGGKDFDVTEIQEGYVTCTILRPSLFDAIATENLKNRLGRVVEMMA